MRDSRMLRRGLVACVMVLGLSVLLPLPVAADGAGDGEAQVEADGGGLLQDVLDWLVSLIDPQPEQGSAAEEGEGGPRIDPIG